MAYNSRTSYEIEVVELYGGDKPRGQYSVLLTIQRTLTAMPMVCDDNGSPTVQIWDSKDEAKRVASATKEQIMYIHKDPQRRIKGYVAHFKRRGAKRYIGYVAVDSGTLGIVKWCRIVPSNGDEIDDTFIVCGVAKAAQAHASELMDGLAAYSIDWTNMPISPSQLG